MLFQLSSNKSSRCRLLNTALRYHCEADLLIADLRIAAKKQQKVISEGVGIVNQCNIVFHLTFYWYD
jgi:hypothetical protein